jgi:hypothetical protein
VHAGVGVDTPLVGVVAVQQQALELVQQIGPEDLEALAQGGLRRGTAHC